MRNDMFNAPIFGSPSWRDIEDRMDRGEQDQRIAGDDLIEYEPHKPPMSWEEVRKEKGE